MPAPEYPAHSSHVQMKLVVNGQCHEVVQSAHDCIMLADPVDLAACVGELHVRVDSHGFVRRVELPTDARANQRWAPVKDADAASIAAA